MSYDVNKLTKLAALKALAEKMQNEYTTLSDKVDELVTTGGEPNKLEKVKVNGQEQNINPGDKSVDIKVPTKVSDLTDKDSYATKEEMNAKISSVYKPGGSKTFASLPEPSANNLGTVYDVTDKFTTDTRFTDGAGIKYPAGSNVAVVDVGSGDYKYDVLAGFVDLTEYAKTADVVAKDGDKKLSTEDYTTEDKNKLAGIDDHANNYVHPTSDAGAQPSGLYKITTDEEGHVTGAVKVNKTDITQLGIPEENTTYSDVTAGGKSGLMSGADKKKLDDISIATEEEVSEMLDEVFAAE